MKNIMKLFGLLFFIITLSAITGCWNKDKTEEAPAADQMETTSEGMGESMGGEEPMDEHSEEGHSDDSAE